jgi:hypothetical protein
MQHIYLAGAQRTCTAILPIHTKAEKALFRVLASLPNGPFSGPNQPNWVSIAQRWSSYSDGITIFYKVGIIDFSMIYSQ